MSTKTRHWIIRSPADLGRAVAGVRAAHDATQAELAAELGIDRSYLARLEAGASTLALERALRALRHMGATVAVSFEDGADGDAG
jgi:transcriptional regulator with XRE-family HTH domain